MISPEGQQDKPISVELEVQNNVKDVEAVRRPSLIMVHSEQQASIRRKVQTLPGKASRTSCITSANISLAKFDRHMLPIVCVLYILSYLDRGNIGNAKTAGIMEDLDLDDADWTWVLQTFYICYVLFEWTQLFWKILPAHVYVATLCML